MGSEAITSAWFVVIDVLIREVEFEICVSLSCNDSTEVSLNPSEVKHNLMRVSLRAGLAREQYTAEMLVQSHGYLRSICNATSKRR
jgi:hypothetical protein